MTLSGQVSLSSIEWNLWQMERVYPKRKFPIEIYEHAGDFLVSKRPTAYVGLVRLQKFKKL